jgi:hypothetical protein
MRPARIENHTSCIGKPANWDELSPDRDCGALFVRKEVEHGIQFLKSAWEPSTAEIGMMLSGSMIVLGVSSPEHPVINMSVLPQPDEFTPPYVVRRVFNDQGVEFVRVEVFCSQGRWAYAEFELADHSFHHGAAEAIKAVTEFVESKGWL